MNSLHIAVIDLCVAVVKTIMDLHHAGVSITNRPEGGARVTMTFAA